MNDLIVKSNYIIEASYKLSLEEQRIIHILTSMIDKDDVDFTRYRLTVKEFAKITKTKDRSIYKNVAGYVESLRHRDLTIIKENSILRMNWLSSAEYFDKQGYIELEFSPKLKPYLLQLKESFTKLSREKLVSFRSQHTGRVYELLKQYEKIKCREITLEKFKKYLGFEDYEYRLYSEIKRSIITKALNEINKNSDLNADYEEIKDGRKVIALKFFINTKSESKRDEIASTSIAEDESDLIKIIEIMDNQIDIKKAKKIYENFGVDFVKIKNTYEYAKNHHPRDIVAYMCSLTDADTLNNLQKKSKRKNADFEQRNYTKKDFAELEKNLLNRSDSECFDDELNEDEYYENI